MRARAFSTLAPLIGGLACGPPAPPPEPTPAPASACLLTESGQVGGDTVRIGLTDPVDPARAPVPGTDAEALIFRQLYEPLVGLDCEGVAQPALARAWEQSRDGRAWTFALRPDVAFWDGTPLDADAVLAGWRESDSTVVVEGVRADRRSVTVFLSDRRPVEFFADPSLRVVKRIAESSWPVGTGAWWVREASGAAGRLVARPVTPRRGAPTLVFLLRPAADPRDLLDAGVDLLVTRDPRARSYAAGRAGWTVAPLGWDRTYGLVSRALGHHGPTLFPAAFLESLARDAVPGDARAAPPDDEGLPCTLRPAPSEFRRRVVYPRGDAVARALAERLVARTDLELSAVVGAERTRGVVAAVGLPDAELEAALATGRDLGYVGVVTPGAQGPCAAPLVQTRPYGLAREGVARIVRDQRGVRVVPTGAAR